MTDEGVKTYNNENGIYWTLNGQLHREDGPAVEWKNGHHGRQQWYINGKLHREDGPAMIRSDGREIFYLNGERIDVSCLKDFIRIVKLKVFF
jgi:hypothetical protein